MLYCAGALVVVVATGGQAVADPAFPPSFPLDQNQLPQLPSEPQIYDLLPIPAPDNDPWYDDPADVASYAPGQIVRTREVQTRLVGIPFPVYTKQLLYRTTNAHGGPIVTATTVLVPGVPWTGSPRPVLSYQEAIDATDSSCNPSHTLQVGTMKEIPIIMGWLAQGFAVNVPDFDGKFNTFATVDEGYMVLDSLRAMKNDTTLGLADSGIAIYGFSGGGTATMRAAELRATYAPDVEILGAAGGGLAADLLALAEFGTARQPGFAGAGNFTMWLGMAGLAREYPDEFNPKELLTEEGQAIVADMGSRCLYTAAATGAFRPLSEYYQPGKSLDTAPGARKVLQDNSLGKNIPDIPLLWWHGFWDEVIPPSTVMPTVHSYFERGADLRFFTVPLPEHVVNSVADFPPAVAWTSALLRGLPPGPSFNAEFSPLPEGFPGT
ncbi:lipase family protein [Rhodococcus sp. 27YEA15]|uniref:lipase family protein n=1 Tax=Rhodococcus sp. 27YEA15 TaxID=3156259 RepID=UPI003C7A27C0